MWPKWLPGRIRVTPKSPRSRSFSCSSFKDIQELCMESPEPHNDRPDSPRSPTVFHRACSTGSALRSAATLTVSPPLTPSVVVYFTSLRVVRRTFEDCRAVRSILRGLRVPIDERDLAMDAGLVAELQGIMGRRRPSLPCVFIGGRLVGGVEEVRRLYESGQLRAMVGQSHSYSHGHGHGGVGSLAGRKKGCGRCGELRYVVCDRCDGSRRIYGKAGQQRICTVCNFNGLIKCPSCSLSVVPDTPYHYYTNLN